MSLLPNISNTLENATPGLVTEFGEATRVYLDTVLKRAVVGALKDAINSKTPSNGAVSYVINRLRESNENRRETVLNVDVEGVPVTLRHTRLTHQSQRTFSHLELPLHADADPHRNEMQRIIKEAVRQHFNDEDEKLAAIGQPPEWEPFLAKMTPSNSRANTPKSFSPKARVIFVAPMETEVILVGGVPMLGNFGAQRAATYIPPPPSPTKPSSPQRHTRANAGFGDSFNIIDVDSFASSSSHSDGEDMDLSGTQNPVEAQKSKPIGMDLEEREAAIAAKIQGSTVTPYVSLGHDLSDSLRSQFGIVLETMYLRLPSNRMALDPEVFDVLHNFIDTTASKDQSQVPTIVFTFGMNTDITKLLLVALATNMFYAYEQARFKQNSLVEAYKRKKQLEKEKTNEFQLVNVAAYWSKVRERRENRDRQREARHIDFYKKVPYPPVSQQATDEEKAIYEEKRKQDTQKRLDAEKVYEANRHAAAVARQARRSREDVEADGYLNQQQAYSGSIIQAVVRGYISRRKEQGKRIFSDPNPEPPSPPQISSRCVSVLHSAKTAHRAPSDISIRFHLLHKLAHDLVSVYRESMSLKPPTKPAKPRTYKTWIPKSTPMASAYEQDVPSESEEWQVETKTVLPKLQTSQYRLFNPWVILERHLEGCQCDIEEYTRTLSVQYCNISPLQRRGFAALQSHFLLLANLIFVELRNRKVGFPDVKITKFSEFLSYHFPHYNSWFLFPSFASAVVTLPIEKRLSGPLGPILSNQTLLIHDSADIPTWVVEEGFLKAKEQILRTASGNGRNSVAETVDTAKQSRATPEPFLPPDPPKADKKPPPPKPPTKLHRLSETSCVYMVSDTLDLQQILTNVNSLIAYNGGKTKKIVWYHTTSTHPVYVRAKPFFATPRFERQVIEGVPGFSDLSSCANIATTAHADPCNISGSKTPLGLDLNPNPLKGRRASLTRSTLNMWHYVAPPPPSGNEILEDFDLNAQWFGVSWGEVEERLRLEVGQSLEKNEGKLSFYFDKTTANIQIDPETHLGDFIPIFPDHTQSGNATRRSISVSPGASPEAKSLEVPPQPLEAASQPSSKPVLRTISGAVTPLNSARSSAVAALAKTTWKVCTIQQKPPESQSAKIGRPSFVGVGAEAGAAQGRASIVSRATNDETLTSHLSSVMSPSIGGTRVESPGIGATKSMIARARQPSTWGGTRTASSNSNTTPGTNTTGVMQESTASGLRRRASMRSSRANSTSGMLDMDAKSNASDEHAVKEKKGTTPLLIDPESLPTVAQSSKQAFGAIFEGVDGFVATEYVRMPLLSIGGNMWIAGVDRFLAKVWHDVRKQRTTNSESALIVTIGSLSDLFYFAVAAITSFILLEDGLERLAPTQSEGNRSETSAEEDPIMSCLRGPKSSQSHHRYRSERKPTLLPLKEDPFFCVEKLFADTRASLNLEQGSRIVDVALAHHGIARLWRTQANQATQQAERLRGSLDCRPFVREACMAIERYTWLVVIASLLSKKEHMSERPPSLKAWLATEAAAPVKTFIQKGIDPWAGVPVRSPDPDHIAVHSNGNIRWRAPLFTPNIM